MTAFRIRFNRSKLVAFSNLVKKLFLIGGYNCGKRAFHRRGRLTRSRHDFYLTACLFRLWSPVVRAIRTLIPRQSSFKSAKGHISRVPLLIFTGSRSLNKFPVWLLHPRCKNGYCDERLSANLFGTMDFTLGVEMDASRL